MERGVRARWNARGDRRQAQCRPERGAATGRYRRAPQAAQRRVAREYAGGVSRLRGGGNGKMGSRGARGQYQVGITDESVSLLLVKVHGRECSAGKGAMRGEDSTPRSMDGSCIASYVTAASD